jgi:hypothetical protein
MTPSISGTPSNAVKTSDLYSTQARAKPALSSVSTSPANPSPDKVSLSEEAKKLLSAKAVLSAPVATAVASNDPQVDKVAKSVYSSQQAQRLADIYQDTAKSAQETPSATISQSV